MRLPSRDQYGKVGMAIAGSVGLVISIFVGTSTAGVLLFAVAALVGITGLLDRPTLQLVGYAVGAVVSLIAGTIRFVRFEEPELLAVLLVAVGTVFALRGVQEVWLAPESEP